MQRSTFNFFHASNDQQLSSEFIRCTMFREITQPTYHLSPTGLPSHIAIPVLGFFHLLTAVKYTQHTHLLSYYYCLSRRRAPNPTSYSSTLISLVVEVSR